MTTDLSEEITNLEDILKAEMTARGTDEIAVDVFKVRWTTMTSHRFDSTAFKARLEIYHPPPAPLRGVGWWVVTRPHLFLSPLFCRYIRYIGQNLI